MRVANWRKPTTVLPGERYGRLVILSEAPKTNGYRRVLAKCDCGNETTAFAASIRCGQTQSCGCLHREVTSAIFTTHGGSVDVAGKRKARWYSVYRNMVTRCENPNNGRFPLYGGRGIKICKRWREDPANFLADMGEPPEGMTLDRIDPNGNYEPSNCRWASWKTQQRNRRNNLVVEYQGARWVLRDLFEYIGVNFNAVMLRLRRGWEQERALTEWPAKRRAA